MKTISKYCVILAVLLSAVSCSEYKNKTIKNVDFSFFHIVSPLITNCDKSDIATICYCKFYDADEQAQHYYLPNCILSGKVRRGKPKKDLNEYDFLEGGEFSVYNEHKEKLLDVQIKQDTSEYGKYCVSKLVVYAPLFKEQFPQDSTIVTFEGECILLECGSEWGPFTSFKKIQGTITQWYINQAKEYFKKEKIYNISENKHELKVIEYNPDGSKLYLTEYQTRSYNDPQIERKLKSYEQKDGKWVEKLDNDWIYGKWKGSVYFMGYHVFYVTFYQNGTMWDGVDGKYHSYTIEKDRIWEDCGNYGSSYKLDRRHHRISGGNGMWLRKVSSM